MKTYHIIGKGIPHNTKVKGTHVNVHKGRITSIMVGSTQPSQTVAYVPKHAVVLILDEERNKRTTWSPQ